MSEFGERGVVDVRWTWRKQVNNWAHNSWYSFKCAWCSISMQSRNIAILNGKWWLEYFKRNVKRYTMWTLVATKLDVTKRHTILCPIPSDRTSKICIIFDTSFLDWKILEWFCFFLFCSVNVKGFKDKVICIYWIVWYHSIQHLSSRLHRWIVLSAVFTNDDDEVSQNTYTTLYYEPNISLCQSIPFSYGLAIWYQPSPWHQFRYTTEIPSLKM